MEGYKLALFAPSRYVKDEFRPIYQTPTRDPFTQADREKFLIGMMKVGFLKRLESSVQSFEITMDRTIAKIDQREQKIARFQAMQKGSDEVAADELTLGFDDDEELRDALEVGTKFKYKLEHLHLDNACEASVRPDTRPTGRIHYWTSSTLRFLPTATW